MSPNKQLFTRQGPRRPQDQSTFLDLAFWCSFRVLVWRKYCLSLLTSVSLSHFWPIVIGSRCCCMPPVLPKCLVNKLLLMSCWVDANGHNHVSSVGVRRISWSGMYCTLQDTSRQRHLSTIGDTAAFFSENPVSSRLRHINVPNLHLSSAHSSRDVSRKFWSFQRRLLMAPRFWPILRISSWGSLHGLAWLAVVIANGRHTPFPL